MKDVLPRSLRPLIATLFNPLGVPGNFVPAYRDFLLGKDMVMYVCAHEAGHVFVNNYLRDRRDLIEVTRRPDWEERWHFTALAKFHLWDHQNSKLNYLMSDVVRSMGGAAGTRAFIGKSPFAGEIKADLMEARSRLHEAFGRISDKKFRRICSLAEQQGYEIIQQDRERFDALVQAIYDEKTLTETRVDEILGRPAPEDLQEPLFIEKPQFSIAS